MKKNIHPKMYDVTVTCTCGAEFHMQSTKETLHSTLCSSCHPFYTGTQKFVDTAGRIEKFKKRYAPKAVAPTKAVETEKATTSEATAKKTAKKNIVEKTTKTA